MKSREVVCTVASGVAGIIWPPIALGLVIATLLALCFFLDNALPSKTVGKWIGGTVIGMLVLGWWVIHGIRTAKWVRERCSPESEE